MERVWFDPGCAIQTPAPMQKLGWMLGCHVCRVSAPDAPPCTPGRERSTHPGDDDALIRRRLPLIQFSPAVSIRIRLGRTA